MIHDFRGRHYTDQAGRIREDIVASAAKRFWAPHGLDHFARRLSYADQRDHAMDLAVRERDRMRENPLCAAIDTVDALIKRRCSGDHESMIREAAILAIAERRPAVVLRHPNVLAALVANEIHGGCGGKALAEWLLANCAEHNRDLKVASHAVFGALVGANREGGSTLDTATWSIAAKTNIARRAA